MIQLDSGSDKPIYEQIIEQIKWNVFKGYLKPGDAIPSVRKLALSLSITPGTVARAYQELERDHVIETIRGKGTFISVRHESYVDEQKKMEIEGRIRWELLQLKTMGVSDDAILQMIEKLCKEL